nr:MAG TPA: hypothetical protein [Caudoviricetes sp.]
MSITSDYLQIRAKLDNAITAGLQGKVADGLKESVSRMAQKKVYDAYTPQPIFEEARRGKHGGIADPNNMITHVEGTTLTLDNVTGLQNLFGGGDTSLLVPIVEEGTAAYYQPGSREFMDDARDEYVDNGDAKDDLMDTIRSAGFTVG